VSLAPPLCCLLSVHDISHFFPYDEASHFFAAAGPEPKQIGRDTTDVLLEGFELSWIIQMAFDVLMMICSDG
jgi:hypothetical protein